MKIKSLTAQVIKTSKGTDTIEVCLNDKFIASVPEGTSRGKFEATIVPALTAVQNIKKLDNFDEEFLINNKERLGANVTLALSIALARLRATKNNQELWQYLGAKAKMPRFLVAVIEGGKHARNNLDIQECLIVIDTIEEAKKIWLEIKKEFHSQLGMEGGIDKNWQNNREPIEALKKYNLPLGVDCAGFVLGDYSDLYYIEDPFLEDEFEKFRALKEKLGNVLIVGDDLTATNLKRVEKAWQGKSINAIIIKPNQIGTVSETLAVIKKAREYDFKIIVSHRSGETRDSFISDLAYGVGADFFKLGTYEQPERIAKYQRLIEINESRAH